MKCPKCQVDNRMDAQFCLECGGKLEISCPACGRTNPPDGTFCDGCGQVLGQTAHPSEPESAAFVLNPPSSSERKHITVLFSDLSGYTAMSEKLDPEEVKEIMGKVFGEISKVVTKYEGFIEKFIGDAVMAIFGASTTHEDDPVRAIKASREIHDIVKI